MKIIVTGSKGFLGQHLMTELQSQGHDPYGVLSAAYDLRREAHIFALFKHVGTPDIIFHLAANAGGIGYNLRRPATIYYDNVMMNTQFIHKASWAGVGKFIFAGSVCSYPFLVPVPTIERHLWGGPLTESHHSYGVSKLMALAQLQAYRSQYNLDFAYPILANIYGPGDGGFFDDFKSHVIPALVKRFVEAENEVICWGTGIPTRDFLYVEDAAKALAKFIGVNCPGPVNIAANQEISILRLAELIAGLVGFKGQIIWDKTKPDGSPRRRYNTRLLKHFLGWEPTTTIEDGLQRTIEWYKEQLNE